MALSSHAPAGKPRNPFVRLVTFLCLTALAVPSAALISTRAVRAASSNAATASAPTSAPPQPFHVGQAGGVSPVLAFDAAVISWTASLFATEKLPKGFEMGHLPTFSEKLTTKIGSAVGFFSPWSKAKSAAPPPTPSAGPVNFDFDADGKADYGRWHTANNEFRVIGSNGGTTYSYSVGSSSYIAAPGDFDGDGHVDAAVFNGTTWKYKTSPSATEVSVTFGSSGDIPVPGNYVGSSRTDMAVYRPSTGYWYFREAVSGTVTSVNWGTTGDIPVPGDYDADGVSDVAVYRPSNGTWYILGSTAGVIIATWGTTGDVPVPADYDGDGKTDLAAYRPSTGTWYVYKSSDANVITQGWGNYGDQPAPADYDGDGKADFCVWRPKTGVWYTIKSSNSSYDYNTLGVSGDEAVSSAYIQQVGASVSEELIAPARLSPKNATGGTNLYSQNFAWGTQLVGLPGRSGLDMGFGISYNSLVWTKVGSSIVFDADTANVSPGFRFGFPTIEPAYYDSKTGHFAYLMVTPSGGRVEFRQTAASDTYETADSNYALLKTSGATNPNDPVEDIEITVTTTDGTQMAYKWKGGAFRCGEIKDRNGNKITISNNDEGLLQTVTDTLGRVITVHYDTELYPTSITQDWEDSNGVGPTTTPHTWATFTYTTKTIDTDFSGLTVFGPPDSTVLKVLQKITYPDGSSTKFYYNGYAQVDKIENYSAESTPTLLNWVSTNLDGPASSQTDCPKFTDTYNWAKNFNVVSGSEVAMHTENAAPSSSTSYTVGSSTFTASKIQVWLHDHPDNLRTNIYVGSSGWNEGLPLASEDCITTSTSCTTQKRWTLTGWNQDNTTATYPINPRVEETLVGDGTNTKRTTLKYKDVTSLHHASTFGLVEETKVYDIDLSTVLKTQTTSYDLDSAYTSRRIIGLPAETDVWQGTTSGTLMSKMTYGYDEEDFSHESNQNISSVVYHDNTNYSSSFYVGRGNLSSTTRWDANYPTNSSYALTSKVRYDIAGSPVAKMDPLNRKVAIDYTDNFNDTTTTRNTYAYPKYLTDPAGNSSTIKYRFDIGANVWAKSPNLDSSTAGKETARELDSLGRISKETIVNNGAYTRYEYPTNGVQATAYSTIIDTPGSTAGADSADEVLSESWTDGAGRVIRTRNEHPNSTGGWAGTVTEYDKLGRVTRQSVPTEISVSGTTWTPAGDDDRGTGVWLWNSQEYDWKGRITRSIPSDSNGSDGKDTLISYDGCGCAGGQITTIQGENIVETDWSGSNPVTKGRRTQKIYADILGRENKTEVYNWDGSTVYATTMDTYNGRDQVTNTRQYAGSTSSSYYRDVTMTYDGFGRMATRHYPIEGSSVYTSWTYNADDSINTVTDPRGVVINFSYYSTTGWPHQITYVVPSGLSSTVPDTPDVTFGYDNVGNRTSMSDGTGSASYVYNSLTQMTSETKSFTGFSGSFTINYTYTLSGGLKTMSDPQDSTRKAVYDQDKTGRVVAAGLQVNSTLTNYIHDTNYRAWGDLKGYDYDHHTQSGTAYTFFNFSYDNRLQVSSYQAGRDSTPFSLSFQRYADGKLRSTNTELLYRYDDVGRMTKAYTGTDANPSSTATVNAYKQELTYNAFSEVTAVTAKVWGTTIPNTGKSYTLSTGRDSNTGYDAAGNIVAERVQTSPSVINRTSTYDAAARQVSTYDPAVHICCENNSTGNSYYDGDGSLVKADGTSGSTTVDPTYRIRSTVLGGEQVGEYHPDTSYPHKVFMVPVVGGELKYTNIVNYNETVMFSRTSPEGLFGYDGDNLVSLYDPHGSDVGIEDPATTGGFVDGTYGRGNDPSAWDRCAEGGVAVSCDKQARAERAFDRIADAIKKDEENRKVTPPANPHGSSGSSSGSSSDAPPAKTHTEIKESPEAQQTTSTDKPQSNPQTAGAVEPASIPCVDSDTTICTRESRGGIDLGNLGNVLSEPANGLSGMDQSAMEHVSSHPNSDDCFTLADLLASQTFKDAAKSAWDRSDQHGFKHEQGFNLFHDWDDGRVYMTGIPRDSRSFFLPWRPKDAQKLETDSYTWVATLHTHPFRHLEKIDENTFALQPWEPSPADLDDQKEFPNIIHITVYPNGNNSEFFVMQNRQRLEPDFYKFKKICHNVD